MKVWHLVGVIITMFFIKSTDTAIFKFEDYDLVNFNLVGDSHGNFSRYYIRDYRQLLNDVNFSFNRKTVLYVHGWIEDYFSESTETIVSAYLKRQDHNIIVIDWGQYSFGEYFSVIPRFTDISKMLGVLLVDLFNRGLNINQLHCIGHSFGSHIMGIMAREVKRSSFGRYKIKRISGLDPAHFGFWPPLIEKPLSKRDAEFVDVIHTDVTFIGTRNRVGHVDFFPNNGGLQPGCPPYSFLSFVGIVNSFCSHQMSWRYWAESVKPQFEQDFLAQSCKNYRDFEHGRCNGNRINFMGLAAQPRAPGVFFLKLSSMRDFTVDESYYQYLFTSLNYRSDLVRIFSIFQGFFMNLLSKYVS